MLLQTRLVTTKFLMYNENTTRYVYVNLEETLLKFLNKIGTLKMYPF